MQTDLIEKIPSGAQGGDLKTSSRSHRDRGSSGGRSLGEKAAHFQTETAVSHRKRRTCRSTKRRRSAEEEEAEAEEEEERRRDERPDRVACAHRLLTNLGRARESFGCDRPWYRRLCRRVAPSLARAPLSMYASIPLPLLYHLLRRSLARRSRFLLSFSSLLSVFVLVSLRTPFFGIGFKRNATRI